MPQYDPHDVVLTLLLLAGATAAALAVVVALGLRRRRRTSERADAALQTEARARARDLHRRHVEVTFAAACAHAADLEDVVELLHDALVELDPRRPHELHLVDPHEPVLRLVFATGVTPRRAPEDASPWHAVAIRSGETLVYETTDVPDVCPHLRSRLVEHCSALAVPLVATDRLLGVLYVTGPDGVAPTPATIATYEQLVRTSAAAIAAAAALADVAATEGPDDLDDLDDLDELDGGHDVDGPGTGAPTRSATTTADLAGRHDGSARPVLPGRASAVAVIDELLERGTRCTLLLFDIDGFGAYHARYGGPTGDDALAAMAEGAARVLDGAGLFRLDGDHLLVVLADAGAAEALRVIDEVRGEIGRAVRARQLPALTVSFGVVEAARGTDHARLLDAVHDALYNARARGEASTVVGSDLTGRGR